MTGSVIPDIILGIFSTWHVKALPIQLKIEGKREGHHVATVSPQADKSTSDITSVGVASTIVTGLVAVCKGVFNFLASNYWALSAESKLSFCPFI